MKMTKHPQAPVGPSTKESEQPQEPQQTEQTDQFTDIQNYWAKSYIEFIGAKGIIKGKAQGIFAPEDNVTRAEFTAMLTRLLELNDKSTATLPFIDVAEKDWFYEIVNTAFASGLIQGKGPVRPQRSYNPGRDGSFDYSGSVCKGQVYTRTA